jgi:hypothetical protein
MCLLKRFLCCLSDDEIIENPCKKDDTLSFDLEQFKACAKWDADDEYCIEIKKKEEGLFSGWRFM